jgi:hypothetical protein
MAKCFGISGLRTEMDLTMHAWANSIHCPALAWLLETLCHVFIRKSLSQINTLKNYRLKSRVECWNAVKVFHWRIYTHLVYKPETYREICLHVQGRRKHQEIGGGAPASRGTFGYCKGHLKHFSQKCWRRAGGGENFSRHTIDIPYRNYTFLTRFFLKTSKFPNKNGTFDINLVFTATLSCTKRALFITKKGTFGPLKKFGRARAPCASPPGSYALVCLILYLVAMNINAYTFHANKINSLLWQIRPSHTYLLYVRTIPRKITFTI